MTVFADETRPFLQGARLTAWELVRDGIETTVITDNMAGALMRQGGVDFVVVGADRIAANGDTANKIGTYSVAVLAREHDIPFYVAAPLVDDRSDDARRLAHSDRRAEREGSDARGGRRSSPPTGALVWNPAFDVTPHHFISGIITERGIFRAPYTESLRAAFAPKRLCVPRHAPASRRRERPRSVLILGIETSCDETSAAVVEETGDVDRPWAIRSNVIASQVPIHREWGGVVPELASRQHIRDICGVVERALDDAGATWSDLGAIAVTQGPGLVGSLLVGVVVREGGRGGRRPAARRGSSSGRPHRVARPAERRAAAARPSCSSCRAVTRACISLPQPGQYQLLSRTRDDAAGEAYDKVAKLLGLGYPGGPVIDRLAGSGNDRAVALPTTRLTHADRNAPALEGRSRFQLQRAEDGGAALRPQRGRESFCRWPGQGSDDPRKMTPVPFLRKAKSRTSARAFSAWS